MANQEHLAILKQGVEVWNKWREEHDEVDPDLSQADLGDANLFTANSSGTNLVGAHLGYANLRRADLSGADLSGANLSGAGLQIANLTSANLCGADLNGADLSGANLRGADLSQANLDDTVLFGANLSQADLNQASLSRARIAGTAFGAVDLSTVKGLETVMHGGPSTIGIDTIIDSQGNIPDIFLREAGIPPSIVEQIPSLIGSLRPIEFYSCFLSYSSKDQEFAERLHADLQDKRVQVWFAPHDLKPGDFLRRRIDEAVQEHDKLLLVLSEHSVESAWVESEVETAFEKERLQKRLVLFPIRLDEVVMHTTKAWAADLRRMRFIGDFRQWQVDASYQLALQQLLRDLHA